MTEIKKIQKILIANRGEIACRVIHTARSMNIKTVAIHASDEAKAKHVLMADDSIDLGNGPLSDTFLNIRKLIEISKEKDVDAIHPGYGFLSENADFCEQVEAAGITFIGPHQHILD